MERKSAQDSFTLDPNAPAPPLGKHLERAMELRALESQWDDPLMNGLESNVKGAKGLLPHWDSSKFPDIGQDVWTDQHGKLTGTKAGLNKFIAMEEAVGEASSRHFLSGAIKERAGQVASRGGMGGLAVVGAIGLRHAVGALYRGAKSRLGGLVKNMKTVPKFAALEMVYPALLATSIGVGAVRSMKDNRVKAIIREALAREAAMKRQVSAASRSAARVGAAVAIGAGGAGYMVGKAKSDGKEAMSHPFLQGFLAELSKEALILPLQGLRAAKAGVRVGRRQAASPAMDSVLGRPNAVATKGSSAARNLLRQSDRIPAGGGVVPRGGAPSAPAAPARPAASNVPGVVPRSSAPAGVFQAVGR